MRRIDWPNLGLDDRLDVLARPRRRARQDVKNVVKGILDEVANDGGRAVDRIARRLDSAPPRRVALDRTVVTAARAALSAADSHAIETAANNIRRFHEAATPVDTDLVETTPGVRCGRLWRPIDTAGMYVPGGSAPLFSSLLMQAIPAQVAGVADRVVMTPPGPSGEVHPAMILAGEMAGLEAIWLLGGAQAIAAMTFGADLEDGRVSRCNKIFGPGNAFVAEAKRQAAARPGGPAVDMPAGPSELLIIADATADARIAAADLLSQAEHDADAQVLLVCPNQSVIDAILTEMERQLETLPRADIARASLAEGRAIRVSDLDEACEVANLYAPEHLALQTNAAEALVDRIRAAGAIFVGRFAAETLGDYAAGPSHVLPTDGSARVLGGLSTASFMTSISVQYVTEAGARALSPVAARLARLEGLEGHARAADLRSAA